MRFLKFGVVGVANTLITLAVFNLVAVVLGWPAVLGNALGWAAGFANSFVWNRRWTFADRTGVDTTR
jgi:putative flippase GtrA